MIGKVTGIACALFGVGAATLLREVDAAASPAVSVASSVAPLAGRGYAVRAYHNRDELTSKIIMGRQYLCVLAAASDDQAEDCALAWCRKDARDPNGGHPKTSKCYRGLVSRAKSDGYITESDGSTNERNKLP